MITGVEALSPIQRAYLVGDQDGLELRGPARYYLACDLSPDHVPHVAARLDRLVRDNDVLRTRVGADLALTTLPPEEAAVEVDFRPVDDLTAADDEVRRELTSDGFRFDGWPQLRVVVVHTSGRASLHLCYALWLMDAASLGRFLAGLVSDRVPPSTEPAPVRRRSARDERFWRERAADLPGPAELPLRPTWRQAGPAVAHRVVTVDATAADRIAKTARHHGLTPPMVYLAAYGAVLGQLGGGAAHTVTVLHSHRTGPLGNHGNTMPLAVPATAGVSFLDVARAVQSRYLSQAMRASLSGAEIVRLGDPDGDPRRLPHPFAFTSLEVDGLGEADLGLRRRWDEVQLRVPQVLIDHQVVMESDGRVRLGFDWRADAFDRGFVDDFVDRCADLVRSLAETTSPDHPLPAPNHPSHPAPPNHPDERTLQPGTTPTAFLTLAGKNGPGGGEAWTCVPQQTPAPRARRSSGTAQDGRAADERTPGTTADGQRDERPDEQRNEPPAAATTREPQPAGAARAREVAHPEGAARLDEPARSEQAVRSTAIAGSGPADRSAEVTGPGGSVGDALHQRVLRVAARCPDAPAVHDESGTLSYADLVEQAGAVADALLAADARPGDHVAVHLPRGRGQVVAILGALLAGCVYVPLDHGVPAGRLDGIARRARVRFAVTVEASAAGWAGRGACPLLLPVSTASGRARPGPWPTAYVIFTSGSTGEPKGVVISHAAVLNTIDAVNDLLDLGRTDCVLSVSSIGFDLSVYDIFGPLVRGASVVMLSERTARDPAEWGRLIDRHRVTVWNSAPALASLLAEEGAATPSVRSFMLSGDWIPLTLPPALERLAPGAEVISLGGATEGAIWSIHHRITDADRTGRSIPYGRPLRGQDVLVLDAARRVCPDWQVGDLYIAGAGVADGYLNDPDRTAAAFSDDPAFGWVYRTGDRGRRLPGGVVEFLGRTDTQVKLNGHRVELGEVEHLLESLSPVHGCAACVRGEGRRRRIVAFVSLAPDAPTTWREDACTALRDALPQYMVPDALVELDAIPLTANGKVDRRKLETLPLDDGPATRPQPRDLLGHEVAVCWQEVLGEPPGPGSFFEAGGGSYDVIRLLSSLRARFGYAVSFGDFMADPTVAGLASRCRHARPAEQSIWTYQPRAAAVPRLRLVLFPPVGGGVSCYSDLIRRLPVDVEVHVVGFDGPQPDAALTVAGLARRCLERLPAEARSGDVPLVLGGWSFGGALAFEAARLCGDGVARVVVVDTPVSAGSRGIGEPSLDGFAADIRETNGVVVDAEELAADPALANRFEVYRQNLALLRDWTPEATRPQSPEPTVTVVECRAERDPAERDAGAWGRVAEVEDVVVLAGGHFDVFDGDNARSVLDAIRGVE
ncbi:amino acid adenylation domain-containing protein [Actinosynnema sp. NPDC051121]